ncbi:MAG: TRAP transporter fused permease subunit [Mycobacteriales bacterium]
MMEATSRPAARDAGSDADPTAVLDPIQHRLEEAAVVGGEAHPGAAEAAGHVKPRWRIIALAVVGVATVVFHVLTAWTGPLTSFRQTSIHVLAATAMCLLNNWDGSGPPGTRRARAAGALAALNLTIVAVGTVYVFLNFQRIAFEFGYARPTSTDIVLGVAMLLAVFAAARRAIGWAFPIIAGLLFAYGLWGHHAPGVLSHAQMSFTDLVADGFISPLGIFGAITATSATDIAVFIILGGLLMTTGGGDGFLKLALVVAGRRRGGPGKVVVVSSALFGMINGSAVANTASTGAITIPMMIRYGFRPRFAAGIEAAASTGGQWTPPIMGAVVFLMAQLLSIPYYQLAVAAIIPAVIFYVAFFCTIHTEANKHGLVGIPKSDLPKLRGFVDELCILFPPVLVLLFMIVQRYPVRMAGFAAVVTLLAAATVIQLLWRRTSLRDYAQMLIAGSVGAASTIGVIGVLVAGSQVIVAVVGTTALGLNLGQLVFQLATASLLGALLLAGVINIVLGLSLPTVPSYLIAIAITGAALEGLGLEPIAVHFFALYFATLGGLTPPIGATCFVAAAIAKTGWVGVSFTAMRLSAIAFIMPFVFALRPELLLVGDVQAIVEVAVSTAVGAVALSVAMTGYGTRRLRVWEVGLLLASAAALLVPGGVTNLFGAAGVGLVFLAHFVVREAESAQTVDNYGRESK